MSSRHHSRTTSEASSRSSRSHHHDEPVKMRIRVKVPRQRDENGKLTPHKHRHTHGAEPSIDERATKNTTASVTQNNPFTEVSMTVEAANSQALTNFELTTQGSESSRRHRRRKEKKPDTGVFTELGDDFSETKVRNSKFLKHNSDDDTTITNSEALETKIDTATILSRDADINAPGETTLINAPVTQVTFDSEEDPFFVEINDYLKKANRYRRHEAGEWTIATDDGLQVYEADEAVEEDFDLVEPWRLYPKATCPPELRPSKMSGTGESAFGAISEPEERSFDEVTFLVTATSGSADFMEADTDDSSAMNFVYVSATTTQAPKEDTKTDTKTDTKDENDKESYSYYSEDENESSGSMSKSKSKSQSQKGDVESVQSIQSLNAPKSGIDQVTSSESESESEEEDEEKSKPESVSYEDYSESGYESYEDGE